MGQQDESFPTYELFDLQLRDRTSRNPSMQRQFSSSQNEEFNFERKASPFLNSDCSQKACLGDAIGLDADLEEQNHANKDDEGSDERTQLDTSFSQANNSTVVNNQSRNESYERLLNENNRLLNEKDQLLIEKNQLLKNIDENLLLMRNFKAARDELDILKRQGGTPAGLGHPLRSLSYYPPFVGGVAKATQIDLPPQQSTGYNANLSDLFIAANAIPHSHFGDNAYESSAGSIEISLLSVQPAARPLNPNNPLSLNFSNNSAEVDAERAQNKAGGNLQPKSSNRIVTNNMGSRHPSSNDSAIEVEGKNKIFDKRSNRVLELVELDQAETTANANSMHIPCNQNNRRYKSLASRMLRLFGPCACCDDPNRSLDTTNAFTSGHMS